MGCGFLVPLYYTADDKNLNLGGATQQFTGFSATTMSKVLQNGGRLWAPTIAAYVLTADTIFRLNRFYKDFIAIRNRFIGEFPLLPFVPQRDAKPSPPNRHNPDQSPAPPGSTRWARTISKPCRRSSPSRWKTSRPDTRPAISCRCVENNAGWEVGCAERRARE